MPSRAAPSGAAPLDLAAALAGRRAELEITPQEGAPWRGDLVALLLREARQAPRWQAGPLALQARLVLPVRLGQVTSLRLVADIAARADGSLWVDLWLRNDIAMQPGGGELVYALRLALDGREALAATVPRHWQYAAWGRLLGGARDGTEASAPRVIHDPVHLAAATAILPFDVSTGVEEAVLESMARMMQAPGWAEPLGARGIQTRMGTTGSRADLGQVTLWQAAWLVTGDARAAAFSIRAGEAAARCPGISGPGRRRGGARRLARRAALAPLLGRCARRGARRRRCCAALRARTRCGRWGRWLPTSRTCPTPPTC